MTAPSRNDIFSTWSSSDSPVPPPASDLVRRRTTGAGRPRSRKTWPRAADIFPHVPARDASDHPAPIELPSADPSPLSASRNSSFFDVSHGKLFPPYRHPPSPGSTRSVTTASLTGGTSSSTNPSLAASLPPSPPSLSLQPIQLRFTPRPELKLGQGRFSRVYVAACRHDGERDWRVCAVKRLEPDDESQALGLREAWFLRQLRQGSPHPARNFITRLLGVQTEEKERTYTHARSVSDSAAVDRRVPAPRTLLVLEYYPTTLSSLIATHPTLLTPKTFTRLASELAQALAYCHDNHILHTDIKTPNVLLTSTLSVRLADFGSAVHLPSCVRPTDAAGLGTPAYSAPEFFRPPPSEFGFPADVFSTGVTLGAALFAREPYARLSARACRPWVSRGAYWLYEEQQRLAPDSITSREDEPVEVVGKDQFETVLGRGCTDAELESLVLAVPEPRVDDGCLDVESYSDGSPATWFPGPDQTGVRVRVPEKLLFVLKHMVSPVPEQRPTMADVARRIEAFL